jgi:hypothetical protein
MNRNIILSLTAGLGVLIAIAMVRLASGEEPAAKNQPQENPISPGKYVDKAGNIRVPEEYRLKWTHLGSWYVEGDKGGDMHDVYTEPETVLEFRKTGKWPQGATIVKEIRKARQGKRTTGQAHWDGEVTAWFVMVRDNKNTFPGNPNWGRGWGWGLFKSDDPKKNTSTDYKVDCIGCHIPAEKTDWVYQHGYPPLNEKEGPFKQYPSEIYMPHEAEQ